MDIKQKTIWIIKCSTGCSCCSCENHYRGPYKTEEDAKNRLDFFATNGDWYPLASQYAHRGIYRTIEETIEELPDTRWIISNSVIDKRDFVKVNEDGSVEDNDDYFEYFL